MLFTACEKIEPDFFDENANGAYFDYDYSHQFEKSINFRDYVLEQSDAVPVKINVRLLGYLSDETRSLSIKSKAVEEYELADVTIPEVTFAGKEYQKEIEVFVKRPEIKDSVFAVCLYIDDKGDISSTIDGKDEFTIYVTESYEQPEVWNSTVNKYIGAWSKEAHEFLARFTNDNAYYDKFYKNNNGELQYDVNTLIAMNQLLVNTLLEEEPAEPIAVEVPILRADEYAVYEEPFFWKEHPGLGKFYSAKFCRLSHEINAANTKNIIERYASEEVKAYIEENKTDIHKQDVKYMLDEYYRYPRMGYSISEYKELFWVEINNKINYDVRIPYWWEDPDKLGCKSIVEKYYGEYDNSKYQFMIKTILKNKGSDFVVAELFPFSADLDKYKFDWDNEIGGEEKFKEYYNIIKAAYDAVPAGVYKFTFPELGTETN